MSPIPRARAVVTNGCSSTCSNSSRVTWPRNPASGIARVSAGSTVPQSAVPPMTGNTASFTAKTTSRMTPSQ